MTLKAGGRILSIDYGSKRVGIAMTDPLRILATAVDTVHNDNLLFGRIRKLIEEHEVSLVLVGMPYSADGGKGEKAREVEAFICRLKDHIPIEIASWDESLTSVEARRQMREAGLRKKQRQDKSKVDAIAARVLLQDYLEYHQ